VPPDPQVVPILNVVHGAGATPIERMTVAEAREALHALAALGGEPEAVDGVEDLTVGGAAGPLPARRYRPAGAGDADLGVLVWLHGGGWVIGDLDTTDRTARALANRGRCVVVSVGYRLAPEDPFPAAVEDAYAATAWVAGHPAAVGADTTRLAVGGDSAGGNLAAVTCLLARDAGGPSIAFQLLVYPATDQRLGHPSMVDNGRGYLLTADGIRWFVAHYLGDHDRGDWRASPLLAPDLSGLPPALVVTAELDPLRDEGEAYAARLREAGVAARTARYDGQVHGFVAMTSVLDAARLAVDEAGAALRTALA
jgi:acetyl esterase